MDFVQMKQKLYQQFEGQRLSGAKAHWLSEVLRP